MSQWRTMAISMLPSLRREIELADNRILMWSDLRDHFCAHAHDPSSELCRQIIAYYRWSVSTVRETLPNEVQTSAVLGFLEDMIDGPERLRLLAPWLGRAEVLAYSWNITYTLAPTGRAQVEAAYDSYERSRAQRP